MLSSQLLVTLKSICGFYKTYTVTNIQYYLTRQTLSSLANLYLISHSFIFRQNQSTYQIFKTKYVVEIGDFTFIHRFKHANALIIINLRDIFCKEIFTVQYTMLQNYYLYKYCLMTSDDYRQNVAYSSITTGDASEYNDIP